MEVTLTVQAVTTATVPVVNVVRRARQLQQQNEISRDDRVAISTCFEAYGRDIPISEAQLLLSGHDKRVQRLFEDMVPVVV